MSVQEFVCELHCCFAVLRSYCTALEVFVDNFDVWVKWWWRCCNCGSVVGVGRSWDGDRRGRASCWRNEKWRDHLSYQLGSRLHFTLPVKGFVMEHKFADGLFVVIDPVE